MKRCGQVATRLCMLDRTCLTAILRCHEAAQSYLLATKAFLGHNSLYRADFDGYQGAKVLASTARSNQRLGALNTPRKAFISPG